MRYFLSALKPFIISIASKASLSASASIMVITHELNANSDENERPSLTFDSSSTFSNLMVDVPKSERCAQFEK